MTVAGLALVALVGLMIGSFLNVCIGRIPAGESIVSPGSRCPTCRTPIAWFDNVPIVGYLVLGGRCRQCKAVISARYPIVEAVTAAAFVIQALVIGDDIPLLISRLVLTALLIVLFGTDLDTQRLPDVLTFPGLVVGIISSCFLPPGIVDSLIGAALGAGILLLIRWVWQKWKGVDGMGLGDVKMLAMIGAFLGWQQIWIVLFLSSFAGAIIGVSLTLGRGRSMQSRLPFGTFLALAAYAASLWGDRLLHWYLSISGM